MGSKVILILLIAIVSLLAAQNTNSNKTETIEVVKLAYWIVHDLPAISPNTFSFLTKFLPPELNVVLTSVGYVVIFISFAVVLLISLIVVSFLQCCNHCSNPEKDYGTPQVLFSKILNTIIFFTIIIVSIAGIYYCFNFNSTSWNYVNSLKDTIEPNKNYLDNITKDIDSVKALNVSLNYSIPNSISYLTNATDGIENFISLIKKEEVKSFEELIPIFIFVGVIAISIVGMIAGFFKLRCVYAFVAVMVLLVFIVMLVAGLSSGVVSILLSDLCVNGVDTQVTRVIDTTISFDNCTKATIKEFITCTGNTTCNPIADAKAEIKVAIAKLEELYNNTHDLKYNKSIEFLNHAATNLNFLSNCTKTKEFYKVSTTLLCGDMTSYIIKTTSMIELIVGLSFVFFLVFYFSWNRFKDGAERKVTVPSPINKSTNNYVYKPIGRRTRNDSIELEGGEVMEIDKRRENFSVGCFFMSLIIFAVWGAITFGAVIVVSIGSELIEVPRV